MSKLPSEISLLVARKATDVWKIDDLLKTIKSEVEAREMSEMARSNTSEKPPNKKQGSLPTVGSFVVTKNGKDGEGSFKVRCAFCHELHYSASCKKVTDRDSRLKLLRDSNRCFVCLKIGHHANMCDITNIVDIALDDTTNLFVITLATTVNNVMTRKSPRTEILIKVPKVQTLPLPQLLPRQPKEVFCCRPPELLIEWVKISSFPYIV
jgi:hypothetical protein